MNLTKWIKIDINGQKKDIGQKVERNLTEKDKKWTGNRLKVDRKYKYEIKFFNSFTGSVHCSGQARCSQ